MILWDPDSLLDHSYTFWTMPIMIFSPVSFFSGHTLFIPLWVYYLKNLQALIRNFTPLWYAHRASRRRTITSFLQTVRKCVQVMERSPKIIAFDTQSFFLITIQCMAKKVRMHKWINEWTVTGQIQRSSVSIHCKMLKFIYSEKATKLYEIFTLLLTCTT